MKKWTLFYTDAEHPAKLQQGVGVLGIPTKEQFRQFAMSQQEKKLQQLATGRCARIREKREKRSIGIGCRWCQWLDARDIEHIRSDLCKKQENVRSYLC